MRATGNKIGWLDRIVSGLGLLFIGAAVLAADAPPSTPPAEVGWRATIRNFAAEHFKNPAWGYSHSMRDYLLARELATTDHVTLDDDVLFAAAFLHDMAAYPPWAKPDVDHADEAARIVETELQGTGFPMNKLDAVRGAIRTHMFDRDPVGPEALYLHDADGLDWLGAIGVARIIALVDPSGGKPQGPDVMPMLEGNFAKVPSRILSPAGRAAVARRKGELAQYLQDLRRETADYRTL